MTNTGLRRGVLAVFLINACSLTLGQAGIVANNPQASNSSSTAPSAADASKRAEDAVAAASAVEGKVAIAADDVRKAQKYEKAINDISAPTASSSQSPADNVQSLQTAVRSIQTSDVADTLSADASDLATNGTLLAALNQACDTQNTLLQPAKGAQQDVTSAINRCSTAQKDAGDVLAALSSAQAGIISALASIAPYMAKQFDDLADKVAPFSNRNLLGQNGPNTSADAVQLLQALPKGLPAFRDVLDNTQQFSAAWKSMQPVVKPALPGNSNLKDPDQELPKLQATVDGIKMGLAAWIGTIAKKVSADTQVLDGEVSPVLTDPAANSAAAVGDVRDKTSTVTAAQGVVDAVPPLVGFLEDGKPKDFTVKAVTDSQEDLQKRTNVLRASISRVHDALAGDFSGFETDQVSLYYFTDVARLMYALNEGYLTVGGIADAQAKAAAQRTVLTQAELDLADAQASVNRYQKQAADLQEQQRQAQVKLKGLNSNVSKLANRVKNAQDAKDQADANYKLTQDNQTNAPSDPTQKLEVDKAAADQTKAATKLSQSQSDYDAAKADQQKAQTQLDDTQNQKDSLPAKLAAAQQAMSDAQTAVAAERRKMIMSAQAESDAFAFARDNTPFMYAMADASSSNPAKRVLLYAFNDSKTIFMRGKRSDLDEVKRIIAAFDQPAPQARLTLWTFELSAVAGQKANKGSAAKLNRAMDIVDGELSDTRALQNTTLTLLRELINKEVREKSSAANTLPACNTCTPEDLLKLARLGFYDPLVLQELHFDGRAALDKAAVNLLRGEIPDPAGTTTLGEALMVLSLAPPPTRAEVRNRFESEIVARLRALPISEAVQKQTNSSTSHSCPDGGIGQQCFLPLTWHALGIWETDGAAGLTSQQLEIVRALRTAYSNSVLSLLLIKAQAWFDEIPLLSSQISSVQQQMASLEDKASKGRQAPTAGLTGSARTNWIMQGLSAADQQVYITEHNQLQTLQARQQTIEQESVPLIKDLQSRGYDIGDLVSKLSAAPMLNTSGNPLQYLRSLSTAVATAATPREAAADEMLKSMVIAIEDDLDRAFMQPMIQGLRQRLIFEAGVNVGILQRESMLATNRGKARVDPRASAQLAVGEQEDILSGIQQLAQLYATVQSGGTLAALGALQGLPREQQPEIYALTTGNKFEVTPVFDPSGQALRFKFDFVGTTNLQEPNGTTNPQLPRIERHTVNTEVQLSNLETREISRYESDSRLGLPVQYWGGIPIFKDIPYVRPWIPLIGWFVRKAGSNAVAQQSVMFGQTTIYPSIPTMVSLLEDTQTTQNLSQTGGTSERK